MAAKTPKIATMGNLIAAGLTFIVGNTFTFMGGYTRLNYGPDSRFASFTVSVICCLFYMQNILASFTVSATCILRSTIALHAAVLFIRHFLFIPTIFLSVLRSIVGEGVPSSEPVDSISIFCEEWVAHRLSYFLLHFDTCANPKSCDRSPGRERGQL